MCLFGGIEGQLAQLASAASEAAQSSQQQAEAKAEFNKKAQIAEDELKVALKQEIGQGLVDVERKEDKVIITVGSGGAFASGSANLTPEAVEIMNRIAKVNAEGNSDIKVSGHTDDVPLILDPTTVIIGILPLHVQLVLFRHLRLMASFQRIGSKPSAMASPAQLSPMKHQVGALRIVALKLKLIIDFTKTTPKALKN